MFGNLAEQFKKTTKPASTLFEMNAKLLEELASQQTLFFTGVMADSKKLVKTVTEQSELKGVLAAQSVYAESVRERLTSASKSTYGTMSTMREEVTSLVKTSLEDATANAKQAVEQTVEKVAEASRSVSPVAPVKKPTAKKPVAKKATPKKPAPKAEAEVKAEVAPTTNRTTKKATTAKKAPVKSAPKPEAPPAVKAKAQVTEVKPDEVKSTSN